MTTRSTAGRSDTPRRRRRRRPPGAAAIAVVVLLSGACGNSKESSVPNDEGTDKTSETRTNSQEKVAVDAPGVTDTEIQVSGIASVENPLGGSYGSAFDGVEAYFKMVNEEQGGIYGRTLVLKNKHDDKFTNNKQEVSAVLSQDKPFAVLPIATLLFTGADDLVAAGIPTFGWGVDRAWIGDETNKKLNLFTETGYVCFDCDSPGYPWMAQHFRASKVGVLAYTADQSRSCADGMTKSFDKYGPAVGASVAFADKALQYGEKNFATQVSAMKDAGVQLVLTCMDTNAVIALAQEMKTQELDAKQMLPNGYDEDLLAEYGDLLEGSMVRTDFVGWESPYKPVGLQQFITWMDKSGKKRTELAMKGWLNAALFVAGLRDAGPAFDQQKLIDAINKMTAWKADGLIHGVNWTTAHFKQEKPWESCAYTPIIRDSKLTPELVEGDKAFSCASGKDPSKVESYNEQ